MKVTRRHPIKDSEIEDIIEGLRFDSGKSGEEFTGDLVERAELESGLEIIVSDDQPLLVELDGIFIPFIFSVQKFSLKKVVVDMGAVKHIADGADIMAPGVVEADIEIEEGEIVAVEDEENHRVLAVGNALEKGGSIKGEEGKVVENLHYVGDSLWDIKGEF